MSFKIYSDFTINDVKSINNLLQKVKINQLSCNIQFLCDKQDKLQIGLVFILLDSITQAGIKIKSFLIDEKLSIDDYLIDASIYQRIFELLLSQNVEQIQINGYFVENLKQIDLLQIYSESITLYDILPSSIDIQMAVKQFKILDGRNYEYNLDKITVNETISLKQCIFDINRINLGQNIREISFINCQISDQNVITLCQLLAKQNINLITFNLSSNELTDISCLLLSKCYFLKQIQCLNVSNNKITLSGLKCLLGDFSDIQFILDIHSFIFQDQFQLESYNQKIFALNQLQTLNVSKNLIFADLNNCAQIQDIIDSRNIQVNFDENFLEKHLNQHKSLEVQVIQVAKIFTAKTFGDVTCDLKERIFSILMQTFVHTQLQAVRKGLLDNNIYKNQFLGQFYDFLENQQDIILTYELFKIDQFVYRKCQMSIINASLLIEADLRNQSEQLTSKIIYGKILKVSMKIKYLQLNILKMPNIAYLEVQLDEKEIQELISLKLGENNVKILHITTIYTQNLNINVQQLKNINFPYLRILEVNGQIVYNNVFQLQDYQCLKQMPDSLWKHIYTENAPELDESLSRTEQGTKVESLSQVEKSNDVQEFQNDNEAKSYTKEEQNIQSDSSIQQENLDANGPGNDKSIENTNEYTNLVGKNTGISVANVIEYRDTNSNEIKSEKQNNQNDEEKSIGGTKLICQKQQEIKFENKQTSNTENIQKEIVNTHDNQQNYTQQTEQNIQQIVSLPGQTNEDNKSYITTQELQFIPQRQQQQDIKYAANIVNTKTISNKGQTEFTLFTKQKRSLRAFQSQFQNSIVRENVSKGQQTIYHTSQEFKNNVEIQKALLFKTNTFTQRRFHKHQNQTYKSGKLLQLENKF